VEEEKTAAEAVLKLGAERKVAAQAVEFTAKKNVRSQLNLQL
jgi:hypothetical protein